MQAGTDTEKAVTPATLTANNVEVTFSATMCDNFRTSFARAYKISKDAYYVLWSFYTSDQIAQNVMTNVASRLTVGNRLVKYATLVHCINQNNLQGLPQFSALRLNADGTVIIKTREVIPATHINTFSGVLLFA